MSYQVSQSVKSTFEQIIALPEVQQGLQYLKEDNSHSIEEQIEFTLIEAPTFQEKDRAERLKAKFEALGIEDVQISAAYNVDGVLRGATDAQLLTEAHIDTVFPQGTVKEVRREGDMLFAPGIYDNARGIACLLAALRAIRLTGLRLERTLIVAGTSREEATGSLGGMRELIAKYPHADASISVDGGFMDAITCNATYSRVAVYTFSGVGGHAFSAFGTAANPVGAACRAAAKINDLQVPTAPKTTYALSKIVSSEKSGVTAIPDSCKLYINYRSDSEAAFAALEQEIEACIQQGCEEENARWNADRISVTGIELSSLPGGRQDPHLPLVEANYLCAKYVGSSALFRESGNSNSNVPISLGIPAVTVGSSTRKHCAHSLEEQFCTSDAYTGPQGLFLLLLMSAGIADRISPCF